MIADDQKLELRGLEGILIYKDAFESNTYYYCSTRPCVGRSDGGYQFTLLRYDRPKNGKAAALSFVVDLDPCEDDLQLLAARLREQNAKAQWKPMPWTSGKVTAAMIGATPVHGAPSLFGRNSAVLNMGLSTEQYLLLRRSLQQSSSPPISVVYQLSYDAFRRAYEYGIDFDQNRFRDWVQKKCTAGFLFISFEKVETFEELKESGVIKIRHFNQTGDPPPEGFQRAFLRSLENLFTPAPRFATPPERDEPSWQIGFECSSIRDVQNITREFKFNMEISGAVSRSILIQGALGGLSEACKECPETVIPTEGAFQQKLTLRCHDSFDDRGLGFLTVFIQGQYKSSHIFDNNHREDWSIELVYDPRDNEPYFYCCELNFRGSPEKLKSSRYEIDRSQAFIDIIPAELYTLRRFSVHAANEFPWDLIRSVTVTVKDAPKDLTGGFLQLSGKKQSGQMELFSASIIDPESLLFTVTYTPVNGSAFEQEVLPAGATLFLNPFRKRTVTFSMDELFDWSRYSKARVAFKPAPDGMLIGPPGLGQITMRSGADPVRYACWYADQDNRSLWYRTAVTPVAGGGDEQSAWQEASGTVVKITCPAATPRTV